MGEMTMNDELTRQDQVAKRVGALLQQGYH
jgi:ribulose bisphosphate carboxylase small subunit